MRRADLVWIMLWLALLAGTAGALGYARSVALEALDRPEARAEWQAWKAETERASQGAGPVQRRAVKADEPPALILLRDHFAGVLAASLVVCGALVGFVILVLRGVMGEGQQTLPGSRQPKHTLLPLAESGRRPDEGITDV